MGHHTETITISAERAEVIRKNVPSASPRYSFGGGYYRPTFEDRLVSEAVSVWRNNYAGRWDDASPGAVTMTGLRTKNTAYRDSDEVSSFNSLVIPVCADEDVITKTAKHTIEITGKALTEFRANGYIGDAIREAVEKVVGPSFTEVKVVKTPALRKPAATKAAGKTTTVFDVVNVGSFRADVLATRSTETEAKAEAIRLMNEDDRIPEVRIVGRVVRVTDDGTAASTLTVVRRPVPDTVSITVEVTTEKPKAGAKVHHYDVSFDVHS